MDYNDFCDKVLEYIDRGYIAVVNCYYPTSLKRRIIETALNVERVIEKEKGSWNETSLCASIMEEAWEERTEEDMEQDRLSIDDTEYTALLNEDREVFVDGYNLKSFIDKYSKEYAKIKKFITTLENTFEEDNRNVILMEKDIPYEVYSTSYKGHIVVIKRKIEL